MAIYTKHNLIPGKKVTIIADTPPDNFYFEKWAGSGASLEDETAETTIVTMGSISAYYRAIFKPNLSLTVNSVVIANDLKTGDQVSIDAGSPPVGYVFSSWSGDISVLDDVNSSTPTVTMGSSNVVLTANFDELAYTVINYGLLYNWYVTSDARNIAPAGWHLPTYAEFLSLVSFLGGNTVSGGKLKEVGNTYWDAPNTGATNEIGFNGRGAGVRSATAFISMKSVLNLWSSSSSPDGILLPLRYDLASSVITQQSKAVGCSIRFIADSGTPTECLGNNGNRYRTVVINGVCWTADNVAETKYRNGDWISGFDGGVYTPIPNAAWAALTSGALCVHSDNLSNI